MAGAVVAAFAVLPLVYLAVVVAGEPGDARDAVWSGDALALLLRSVGLAAAVTATTIAIAVPLAWLTVRTDLPGRRVWAVLCALPLVIPSYIGAYLMVSALGPSGLAQDALGVDRLPSIYGFAGAWLVLSAFTFPYVLLPVQAVLRRVDPQLEEAARGLGRSPRQVFASVVLPQLVPAIGAGGLLVALYVLSDFGAVSILRFDSFTRVIYTTYRSSFEREGAAALACLLVAVTLLVLWLEARSRRSGTAYHRIAPGAQRRAVPVPLGRWRLPALAFVAAVVLVALVLPVGVLAYWATKSVAADLDWGTVLSAAGSSLTAAALAAAVAAAAALPVALLAARHPGRPSALIERLSFADHALPGIVVALALVFLGTRAWPALYQTLAMLVLAYVVLFLPQAIGSIRAALLQIDPHVEEAARSLGRSPLAVLRTITAPLARSGVLAGAALVFLTAVKELPATLLLAPIGFDTLATEIWRLTSAGFFERGAVPSLVLLAVSAVPLALLTLRGHSQP
ncbi:MAG TPA: iron ABC transporter permease [Solirubrobacteraceae bacterium]|nr:iron ABC transporter permease [Solirubrobacteraceae bacterium]